MKWYAYVIIALLLVALGFSIRGCRQAEHDDQVTNLAAIDMMVEHKDEMDSVGAIIARQAHERDSIAQSYAKTQGSLKTQIRALRTRYRQDTLRLTTVDTLVITQDSLIESLEAERAAVKVNTDALISTLESKSRLSEDEVSKWIGMWQQSEAGRMADEKAWKRQRRWERIAEIGGIVLIGIIAL